MGPLPLQKTGIQQSERAQKFALRVCLKDWNSPYDNLLEESGLVEPSVQRNHLSLCHLYRIIQELCVHPDAPLMSLPQQLSYTFPRYKQLRVTASSYKCVFSFSTFFPRTFEHGTLSLKLSCLLKLLHLLNILCITLLISYTVSASLFIVKCLAITFGYIFIISVSYYTILCIQCILLCINFLQSERI